MLDLRLHDGYVGMFTRSEAPGAYPNGSRIEKVALEKGDAHPLRAKATVLGSIKAPNHIAAMFNSSYLYFVEWDDAPKVAVGCADWKIRRIEC